MGYKLSYLCPCVSRGYCLGSYLCPCIISAIAYEKLFSEGDFSCLSFLFAFIFFPFAAYNIRRYVLTTLSYEERIEESFIKAFFCSGNSLIQDVYEMEIKKIGIYRKEPTVVVAEETTVITEPREDGAIKHKLCY